MAPIAVQTHTLQRRWSNADGEKVGLWISFGIIITFVLFTVFLGSLNIYLGKPISKLRGFEADQAVQADRAETLTHELEDLRTQFARKTEESQAAVEIKDGVERSFDTQRQLVQQQNDRMASLTRERDEKAAELAASRHFGTEKATENDSMRNHLRDVEVERTRLDRECERLRMQLNFAAEQMARHHRHCKMVDEDWNTES